MDYTKHITWLPKVLVDLKEYENVHKSVSLKDAIYSISNGTWQGSIIDYMWLRKNGYDEDAKKLKRNLPCFVFGGTFPKRRRSIDQVEHTGIIVLDLDGAKDFDIKEKYNNISARLREDDNVAFWFRSPTNGLKIAVYTDLAGVSPSCYKIGYKLISEELKHKYFLEDVDPSTCDSARVCYVSYDPRILETVKIDVIPYRIKAKSQLRANEQEKIIKEKLEKSRLIMSTHEISYEKQMNSLRWLRENIGGSITSENRYTAMFAYACRLAEIGFDVSQIEEELSSTDHGEKDPRGRAEAGYESWIANGSQISEWVLEKPSKSKVTLSLLKKLKK